MTHGPLTVPTVHLNGTSKRELQEQAQHAYLAVGSALKALQDAAPHSRDYYPQGIGAYGHAAVEHESRMERLRSVQDELQLLAEHLF